MHVTSFHQAEHLARQPAHLQGLAIELAGERIQRRHDVGDGAEAVFVAVGRIGLLRFIPDAGIRLFDHLLAEIHADQVVLKMLWSNMYSAASPRLMIHSAIGGGLTPNAMFCAYTAQVAWLSPQMPQMRLVMKWASRGSLPFMKML